MQYMIKKYESVIITE